MVPRYFPPRTLSLARRAPGGLRLQCDPVHTWSRPGGHQCTFIRTSAAYTPRMSSTTVLLISSRQSEHEEVRIALEAVRGQPYRLEIVSSLGDALVRLRQGGVDAILLALNLADSQGL